MTGMFAGSPYPWEPGDAGNREPRKHDEVALRVLSDKLREAAAMGRLLGLSEDEWAVRTQLAWDPPEP